MIQLNGDTHKFQCVMSGTAATTNPDFWACWAQLDAAALDTGSAAGGTLNGNTDVDLVAGVSAKQIIVKSLHVYNRDTAAVTLTFKVDVSGTDRFLYQCVLQVGESVNYSEVGWSVTNTSGAFLSSLSAAGTNKQVMFNNNGSLAGDAGNTWDTATQRQAYIGTNPTEDMAAGTLPSAPASGVLRRSVKTFCGRPTPFITGPSGKPRCLEVMEISGYKTEWRPVSATAGVYLGSDGTNAGTAASPVPTTTNLYTISQRNTYSSVITTQNQQLGLRNSNNRFLRGSIAGHGGFLFVCRFGFTSIKTGCRAFVGFAPVSASLIGADPSTLTNCAGFGFDLGDTAWTFMHNDASGTATKDAISGQATLATNNTAFDAYIFCYPNDTTIYYRLDDVIQGTTLCDTSASSDLPVNTTLLGFNVLMSNGTANTAANDAVIGISSLAIYTER
jgi:hypothetical protein